jgi:BirA family biotin operon repressor/biotin-[acetyl-CoA-carboxylase] ligase
VAKRRYHFKELESTNEFAKGISTEASEWTIVVADKQTNGKGRLGKSWYSPEGGLWFSVVLKPEAARRITLGSTDILSVPQLIPLAAGVAVCEAVSEFDIQARVKWPNDVLVHGKKLAGILAEFDEGTLILGIGFNLNISDFPEEIASIATSLLLEKNRTFDKEDVLSSILKRLKEKCSLLQEGRSESLLQQWRDHSVGLRQQVTVHTPAGPLEGEATNVDNDGALLLKLPSGETKRVLAGDMEFDTENIFATKSQKRE